MSIYCVYLTIYSGNKLPPFYIGSTSVENIKSGYRGSVKSKKYRKIWEEELKVNPNLFKTIIISTQTERKDSLNKERYFQIKLNVVTSPLYINESIATPNGFFGMDTKKENHPRFGKTHSDKTKQKISAAKKGKGLGSENHFYGKTHTSSTKQKIREKKTGKQSSVKGIPRSEETKQKISAAKKGNCPKVLSEEHKRSISKGLTGRKFSEEHLFHITEKINSRPILVCEFCGKPIKGKSNLMQHQRGKNCKRD